MKRYAIYLLATICIGGVASGEDAAVETANHPHFDAEYSIFKETMADMTWPEIEDAAQQEAVVLFPLGVIEEHGPHIACGADLYQAYQQCRLIKADLERRGTPAVIAPPFYWGVNYSTRHFPGSFDIKPETMKAVLNDILQNLQCWGFTEVYMLNCHGEYGHNQAILECAKNAQRNIGIAARWVISGGMARRYKLSGEEEYLLFVDENPPEGEPQVDAPDFHAGAHETGDMVAFFPELVDIDAAKQLGLPEVKGGGYKEWGMDARAVTPLGYAGNPSAYNVDWSKQAFRDYCSTIAETIHTNYHSEHP
ncbi:MAG: creatininase family protein [Calditrichota bacterium]